MKFKILIFFIISLLVVSCSKKKTPDLSEPSFRGPGNFSAEVLGSDSIKLTWNNPPEDFKEVRIFRSIIKHPSSPAEGELIYQGKGISFIDISLSMGQRYYYSIFAFISDKEYSDKVSINAMPYDLTLPRNFQVNKKIGEIEFIWEKPYDVHYNGIRIIRSLNSSINSPNDEDLIYEGADTSFIDGRDIKFPLICDNSQWYHYFFYSFNENHKFSTLYSHQTAFCWKTNSFDINIDVLSPKNGTILGSAVYEISAVAETQNTKITQIEVWIKGAKVYTLSGNGTNQLRLSLNYDFSSLPQGPVDIMIKAFNDQKDSGNQPLNSSKTITVQLDNTKPVVSILSPADNSKIQGIIQIQGQASDNYGVKNVDLYIDGVLFRKDLFSPYNYEWKTTDNYLNEGKHTIMLKAYDFAGNNSTAVISVVVDNPPYIILTGPADKAENISYTTNISALFSEELDTTDLDKKFYVQKNGTETINGIPIFNNFTKTLVFFPNPKLEPNTFYTATITDQIKDKSGNIMSHSKIWTFKTGNYTNNYDDAMSQFDFSTFTEE